MLGTAPPGFDVWPIGLNDLVVAASQPQTLLAGVAEPSERASYDVEDAEGDLMAVSVKVSDEREKTFGFVVPIYRATAEK